MIYIVKAIASASGLADSNVTPATYTLAPAASSGALNFNAISVGVYGSVFGGYNGGTTEVVAAPASVPETVSADGQTKLFRYAANGYNQGAEIPINLPAALSTYANIVVRAYIPSSGDYTNKTYLLVLGTAAQWTATSGNFQDISATAGTTAIQVGNSFNNTYSAWKTFTFPITADTNTVIGANTALKLGFGANCNGSDLFISSITFQ
jgi:hypothetical protein